MFDWDSEFDNTPKRPMDDWEGAIIAATATAANQRTAAAILDAATRYTAAGLIVLPSNRQSKVPTNHDGTPTTGWQTVTLADSTYRFSYLAENPNTHQNAISLVCGPSQAEVIDFDMKAVQYEAWAALIPADLLARLVIERSPSGGLHAGYRCAKIEGNLKLSRPPKPENVKEWKVYIETRGNGGQCLIAPSPGYVLMQNDWASIPTITPDERETLITAARSLTEYNPAPKPTATPRQPATTSPSRPATDNGERPGDRFNREASAATTIALLIQAGWTDLGNGHLTRPGKSDGSTSGSVGDSGGFQCFTSSNADFEADEAYSPFSVYAIVVHRGDHAAAARALAVEYGMNTPKKTKRGDATWPQTPEPAATAAPDAQAPEAPDDGVSIVCAASVKTRPVEWLWPGVIASRKVTLIGGEPGAAKSFLTCDLAARVSTGAGWPDDSFCLTYREPQPPASVLILNAEDDAEDTVVPRLQAAGADLTKIFLDPTYKSQHRRADGTISEQNRSFDFEDVPLLARTLEKVPGIRLVVIDPVTAFLGNLDGHNTGEVRGALQPLNELAKKHGCAILLITHLNKDGKDHNALSRFTGSGAWVAFARAAYLVAKDPADHHRRLMLPAKNNIGGDATGFAYTLGTSDVPNIPRMQWENAAVTTTAAEVLGGSRHQRESRPDQAEEWLRQKLAGGAMESKRIIADAKRLGMSEWTLRQAAKSICEMPRSGFQGVVKWTLKTDAEGEEAWPKTE